MYLWSLLTTTILWIIFAALSLFPPVNPSARAAQAVTLTWSANNEADLAGYNVYLGESPGQYTQFFNANNNTTYTIGDLGEGKTFYLAVSAYDSAGNESSPSPEITYKVSTSNSDTNPPTVALTAPTGGSVTQGTIVTLTVSASDDVGIVGVQFKLNGANLGPENTSNSYSTTWNTASVTPGDYVLTALARDAAGNTATSAPVTVTVQVPSDTTAPTPPTKLSATADSATAITLAWAGASDNVGVTSYNIYRKGASTPLVTTPNTSYQMTGLTPGTSYTYIVTVLDAEHNESTPSPAASATTNTLPDTSSPKVQLTAPTGGSITQGTNVTLTASASDNVGIVGVQFQLNGANLGPEDTTNTYSTTWKTASRTPGDYLLTALARDAAGNTATSAPVTVTVQAPSSDLHFYQTNDSNGLLSLEAEHAHAQTSQNGYFWSLAILDDASGDRGMEATPNPGINYNTNFESQSPRLDFQVYFVNTGTHYVWVRGLGASGTDDSVHVGLDGQGLASSDRISSFTPSWTWSNDTMDKVIATLEVATPGLHTLNVWMREDGFLMDKLVLTTSASYTPTGTGPSESAEGNDVPTDTTAPTSPTTLSATTDSATAITLAWTGASDNVGVTSYNIYRQGASTPLVTTPNTSYQMTGLTPGISYTYIVTALDAEQNESTPSPAASATTNSLPDTTSPKVELTAPTAGSITKGTMVTLTASASDNVGILGVQFHLNGTNLGPEDTTNTYSTTWDTASATPGAYVLTALARDGAGNTATSAPLSVSVVSVVEEPSDSSPVTLTFQNGLNEYAGTVDTFIKERRPTSRYGANSSIAWDTGGKNLKIGLIRFNDLFGTGPNRIPVGASIHSATLTLEVSNPGHPAKVYEVVVAWDEAVTYKQFGNDAGVQADEYGALISQAKGKVALGSLSLDVTDSLVAWMGNPSVNQGWVFIPTDSDGVGIRSSEYKYKAIRPKLTVEYSLGSEPTEDTTPPTPPTELSATVDSATAITLAWAGASDNVGVTSYNIYLQGASTPLATTPNTSYQVTGLTPGISYTYTVTGLDAEHNESTPSPAASATTNTLPDTSSPKVQLTAPTAGSITTGTVVTLTASASDNVGIVGVQFQLNGTDLGPEDTTNTYSTTWDTGSVIPGDYVLTALARDGAGNTATSAPLSVSVVEPPSGTSPVTLTFQNGLNGYTDTVDTTLKEDSPAGSFGTDSTLEWDLVDPNPKFGLIRFDNIVGPASHQIPVGATIQSATLTLEAYNPGNPADVHEVTVAWNEAGTYNQFGGDAGVQVDEYGALISPANGSVPSGSLSFNVTASLAAWTSNPATNRGWIFLPTGGDGVDVRASEYETVALRPKLMVTYMTGEASEGDTTQPTAPTQLSATVDSATAITLAWAGASDNVGVTSYNIYRQGASTPLATTPNTSYQVTGLTPSTSYTYIVTALDAGVNESSPSPAASATTLDTQGSPSGTATLSWIKNTEPDLAGYRIYYGTTSQQYTQVISVGLNTPTHVIGNLAPNVIYYFAISAYDQSGNESILSQEGYKLVDP